MDIKRYYIDLTKEHPEIGSVDEIMIKIPGGFKIQMIGNEGTDIIDDKKTVLLSL